MNRQTSIFLPQKGVTEDSVYKTSTFSAVADGAGGTGIYCGEWADFVLKALPTESIQSFKEFTQWMETFAEDFIEKYEPLVQQDSFKLRKFYDEGSACTLACVWPVGNQYHWITYGDAHVFFINSRNFKSFPFKARQDFQNGTHLLNWMQMPDESGFQSGTITKTKTTQVLLATDEISKHILYLKENSRSFRKDLNKLYQAMDTDESFLEYVLNQEDIGEDDYSLIYLKP